MENTIGIVTALNPHIGYARASAAAQEALVTGRTVADIVLAPGLLTQANLDDILRPEASYGPAVAVPGDSGGSGQRWRNPAVPSATPSPTDGSVGS
ncbi:hypothetical protein ACFVZR_35775 [Streptomyces sp. NPDC058316]|uniref:hypothetical protein n=1 Tax=unclassified Streptomyces TaxID=2593676 RepID=UPI0036F13566